VAEKNYKVGEEIKVIYQAPNGETGLVIKMEIFDATGFKNNDFPDTILVEIPIAGSSMYRGSFTPNAVGEWTVHVFMENGSGTVVKQYSVGNYNLNDIGENSKFPPMIA